MGVLEYLAVSPSPRTQTEIGEALGIRRSTLSDLLRELGELGYIGTVQRRYVAGPRLLAFVHATASRSSLTASVIPTLETLAAATGETAIYLVSTGSSSDPEGQALAVAHIESPQEIRYVGHLGRPLPLTVTQSGMAILASARGPDCPVADRALEARLARIRERGYAINTEDERLVTIIAAPVLSRAGGVLGAISVVGPSERMQDSETRIWPILREAIAQLAA